MKKILLYVLCLGIGIPGPLFADDHIVFKDHIKTISRLSSQNGIRFFDRDGRELSFQDWTSQPLASRDSLSVVFPSGTDGLKNPVGVNIQTLNANGDGITMLLTISDAKQNRILKQEKISYAYNGKNPAMASEPTTGSRWLSGIMGILLSVGSVNAWNALKYLPAVPGRISMIAAIITMGTIGFSFVMRGLFPAYQVPGTNQTTVELSSRR